MLLVQILNLGSTLGPAEKPFHLLSIQLPEPWNMPGTMLAVSGQVNWKQPLPSAMGIVTEA